MRKYIQEKTKNYIGKENELGLTHKVKENAAQKHQQIEREQQNPKEHLRNN